MGLEVFQVSGMSYRMYKLTPKITILGEGLCCFGVAAAREYLFTKGKRVKLYYDKSEQQMGFEIVDKREADAVRVTGNNQININKFIYYYKLDIKELIGSYDLIPHGALVVIDLKKRNPLLRIRRKHNSPPGPLSNIREGERGKKENERIQGV